VLAAGDNERESPVRITLLQAVPKGDKMESIVRACTELGVSRIVPVLTERTIVTLDAGRWRDRARRWQRIAKEAAKQCGRAVVPPVDVPLALDDVLARGDDADLRLCLWEGARDSASGASLPLTLSGGAGVALLVGPEGGFASSEVDRARQQGWLIVGAGPRILRTETAGPAIIAVLQARFGDLGGRR
jgi:16S rRNA (uracil1498-N3)-methyltransferase